VFVCCQLVFNEEAVIRARPHQPVAGSSRRLSTWRATRKLSGMMPLASPE
jgi:hypothetical protein